MADEALSTGSSTTSTIGFGYRKLWQYKSGKALAAKIQLGYARAGNESRSYSILDLETQIDYYFNSRWGAAIKLRQANSDVRPYESYSLGLSTEYFFANQFSVNFEAQLEDYLPKSGVLLSATKYFR